MFKNVTIIIPSYNRHRQLERLLDYYSNYKISIIVGDSTLKPFPNLRKYKNVKYFHYPNYSYAKKIPLIYNKVKTKYVIFCGDDDFVIPKSIKKCIDFLEKNDDYSSAHGHYLRFIDYKNGELKVFPAYLNSIDIDIDSNIPSVRLHQLSINYMQLFYSVTRTRDIRELTKHLIDTNDIKNDNLIELLQAIILCINGKSKIFPFIYCMREHTPDSTGTYTDSLEVISVKKRYKKQYAAWIEIIVNQLIKKEKLRRDEALKKVNLSIEAFLKGLLIKFPFITINLVKVKKVINDITLGIALKVYNLTINKTDLRILKKHAYSKLSGKPVIDEVENYIRKYSISNQYDNV